MASGVLGELRAARDVTFATLGQPVLIDPDGARIAVQALVASQSVTETMGAIPLVQDGRYLRFRAEDAPASGSVLALLDAPGGAEIERRKVTGAPRFADGRRLVVEIDTAPM